VVPPHSRSRHISARSLSLLCIPLLSHSSFPMRTLSPPECRSRRRGPVKKPPLHFQCDSQFPPACWSFFPLFGPFLPGETFSFGLAALFPCSRQKNARPFPLSQLRALRQTTFQLFSFVTVFFVKCVFPFYPFSRVYLLAPFRSFACASFSSPVEVVPPPSPCFSPPKSAGDLDGAPFPLFFNPFSTPSFDCPPLSSIAWSLFAVPRPFFFTKRYR